MKLQLMMLFVFLVPCIFLVMFAIHYYQINKSRIYYKKELPKQLLFIISFTHIIFMMDSTTYSACSIHLILLSKKESYYRILYLYINKPFRNIEMTNQLHLVPNYLLDIPQIYHQIKLLALNILLIFH